MSEKINSTTLQRGNAKIAILAERPETPGMKGGVLFCPGFNSEMSGTKAQFLSDHLRRRDIAFTRFDYQGHGASDGAFEEGVIGEWRDDALAVLDQATDGPQVVVGSSMGGWIAMLLARARPERRWRPAPRDWPRW